MAALRSLEPEERQEILDELRDTVAARERMQANLARMRREGAPHSYQGKVRAQIAACERHEARFRRLLDEQVAA